MSNVKNAEARDKKIVDAYINDGTSTLESIGQEHGLTRERVRQIIKNSGVDIEGVAKQRREDQLERRLKLSTELIASDESIDTLGKFSKATQISVQYLNDNKNAFAGVLSEVNRRCKERVMSLPRPQEQSYTDEDIFEAVRYVHKVSGKPVTTQMYRELARTTDPSASLIQLRMGGVIGACEAAKVPHHQRRPKRNGFTEADVTVALEKCASDLGIESVRLLSFADYSDWAIEADAPSGSRVRQIFGNWNNAKMAVKALS